MAVTDVNGNASHNVFDADAGLNVVDRDSQGRILTLAGRGMVTNTGVTGPQYQYQVTAVDPDADKLTYTLTQGPAGMTINPTDGLVSWGVTPADAGPHHITVRVDDGRGGEDMQNYILFVSTAAPGEITGTVFNDLDGNGQRDGTDTSTPTPTPVTLTQISTTFNSPIDLGYYEPDNSMIASVNYPNGQPRNLEEIKPDGTHVPFSAAAGFGDEVYIAIARSGNLGGFKPADLFVGNGASGQIARITDGGATIISPWVVLPGGSGLIRGGLYFDDTGVFAGDLIISTDAGQIWRVKADGTPTHVGDTHSFLEGVTTIPDDPARYGPLAGTIVAPNEQSSGFYSITADGNVTFFNIGLGEIENMRIIPPNQNFFGVDYGSGRILVRPHHNSRPWSATSSSTLRGATPASTSSHGTAVPFTRQRSRSPPIRAHVTQWEGTAFAPAGINEVPPVALEPGLPNWVVYLDQNHNNKLDLGEVSTRTDTMGNYAFKNLPAGSYTVAEQPQPGWAQTGPAGGVYQTTVAAGQVVSALNFANEAIVTPVPNQPPSFTSTALVVAQVEPITAITQPPRTPSATRSRSRSRRAPPAWPSTRPLGSSSGPRPSTKSAT